MKMEIIEISESQKDHWNNFVKTNAQDGGFLQSFEWGEFKQTLGYKIFYLAVVENNQILAVALLIKHQLPFNQSYLYCPRGPVVASQQIPTCLPARQDFKFQIPKILLEKISEIAKTENCFFLRFEPIQNLELEKFGFKKINQDVQPRQTLILDISKSEEELLSEMKQKTRYNIRLAEKYGITIQLSDNFKDKEFEKFWRLLQQTVKRQKIKVYPKNYYQNLIKILGRANLLKLIIADFNGKIIASNILIIFPPTAYYFFGAFDNNFRYLMAPYLLQWESIKLAKKLGCQKYDFWGVSDKKISWRGITRFKTGFAPQTPLIEYEGISDLIYQPFIYQLYKIYKLIKK